MVEANRKWGMVVDLDRCTGCMACTVACIAENNVWINTEDIFLERRAKFWIRVERYWIGEFPDVTAHYAPILCQHCANAPCEPVCPVYATHRTEEGLNVQIYNRCVGTRYCANNCPYQVRFFNWWERGWPDPLPYQLNPDVTVRSKGLMEKCSFCLQRIRFGQRMAAREGRRVRDGEILPACVQTCPTDALVFGDLNDPNSKVSQLAQDPRAYRLLEALGTDPGVFYLKKVDPNAHSGE